MRNGNPWTELLKLGGSLTGVESNREAAWDRVDMLREIEKMFRVRRWR